MYNFTGIDKLASLFNSLLAIIKFELRILWNKNTCYNTFSFYGEIARRYYLAKKNVSKICIIYYFDAVQQKKLIASKKNNVLEHLLHTSNDFYFAKIKHGKHSEVGGVGEQMGGSRTVIRLLAFIAVDRWQPQDSGYRYRGVRHGYQWTCPL
jgi:hypothetical protein